MATENTETTEKMMPGSKDGRPPRRLAAAEHRREAAEKARGVRAPQGRVPERAASREAQGIRGTRTRRGVRKRRCRRCIAPSSPRFSIPSYTSNHFVGFVDFVATIPFRAFRGSVAISNKVSADSVAMLPALPLPRARRSPRCRPAFRLRRGGSGARPGCCAPCARCRTPGCAPGCRCR